ncbi:hypothetical protein [Asticcacaulis excentricus]|uniref:Uncharacterized protein n=1 Tax=Asticcacaulis excentricus TaxID=78587 RepID=A0A3G9G8E0_9CAUL|nr:hypothetical protein [Asticcacaulis excentricus]BBF81473.1 hypothetical protein EM6_2073 [Asticcacaulis excentricus]
MRAFADRMLLRAEALDDPEDMQGVERAVRVAAVIERIYSRCDRAETQAPDPRKLEAERAQHYNEALKARVSLAGTLKWTQARRTELGPWWEAAKREATSPRPQADAVPAPAPRGVTPEAAKASPVASPSVATKAAKMVSKVVDRPLPVPGVTPVAAAGPGFQPNAPRAPAALPGLTPQPSKAAQLVAQLRQQGTQTQPPTPPP